MIYKNISGIILVGGKNSRIGVNKIQLQLEGKTLLEIMVNKLQSFFSEILIVIHKNQKISIENIQIIEDIIPEKGSLGGLYSGLVHSSNDYNFVCACDMPYISLKIIKFLINKIENADVVVPKINGYYEPLCAVYSKSCINSIHERIEKNQLAIKEIFSEFHSKEISEHELKTMDPEMFSFFNINTKNDYQKALELYQQLKGN